MGLFVATVLVHPIAAVLTRPYWFDEAWVAVLTRVPWSSVPKLSSSTPVGFLTLVRLVPGTGLQRGRLVVLAFSAATAALAYALTRAFAWATATRARLAATAAALVTTFAPLALARNDLKQYTCDAFCALLVLAVGAWAERAPARFRMGVLVLTAVVVLPFSSTSAFVSVSVFGAILLSALLDRARGRLLATLSAGAFTAIVFVAYFRAVIFPASNPKLRAYWDAFYLRGTPWHMVADSWTRLSALNASIGMPAAVFVVLFGAGLVVLWRLAARTTAIGVALVWVEMPIIAWRREYPFLDLRTSHFLLVASLVVVTIGAFGIVEFVYDSLEQPAGRGAALGVGLGVSVVLASAFGTGVVSYLGASRIPPEDGRAEATYVAAHVAATDVILVNDAGSFAFSYYWPHGSIATVRDDSGQGFRARVRGLDAFYARGRTDADVLAALRAAVALWRAEPHGSRIFIVRSHVVAAEAVAWERAFAALHLQPRSVAVGVDPVLVLGPPGGVVARPGDAG